MILTPTIKEGYYLSDVEMNYDNISSSSMSTSSSEYTKTITFTMEADNLMVYFTCSPLSALTIAADSHVTAVQAYLDYERTEPVSTYNPYVRIFLLFTTTEGYQVTSLSYTAYGATTSISSVDTNFFMYRPYFSFMAPPTLTPSVIQKSGAYTFSITVPHATLTYQTTKKDTYQEGDIIRLGYQLDDGYYLDSTNYDFDGATALSSYDENSLAFQMPAKNVAATFDTYLGITASVEVDDYNALDYYRVSTYRNNDYVGYYGGYGIRL